jgi:hypothetical protein
MIQIQRRHRGGGHDIDFEFTVIVDCADSRRGILLL